MKYLILFSLVASFVLSHNSGFAINLRDVTYETQNAGKVVFSHNGHINKPDMKRNCRACHDAIFDLKKKKHYSMADMEKGRSCGACHGGKKAFSLKECARCHTTKEIVYRVKATGPTRFSHSEHLATNADCRVCHPSFFAAGHNKPFTMAQMEKGKSCGACHNSKQAFPLKECSKCHPTRELVFEEKSTGKVTFSHLFHAGQYSCVDCHTALYKTARSKVKVSMQFMEQGKSCGACHDGKAAFTVKENCELCHKM